MKTIDIKNADGAVIFSHTCDRNTIRKTLEVAVSSGVSLFGAQLQGADLSGANLFGADLRFANMTGVTLSRTILNRAVLNGAVISPAFISATDLGNAELHGAIFYDEVLPRNITCITGMFFDVTITDKQMIVEHERHTHDEWRNIPDEHMDSISHDMLPFWKAYKKVLFALCDAQRNGIVYENR